MAKVALMDFDEALERFEPVLGFEVHVELNTATKMFSAAPNPANAAHHDADDNQQTNTDALQHGPSWGNAETLTPQSGHDSGKVEGRDNCHGRPIAAVTPRCC